MCHIANHAPVAAGVAAAADAAVDNAAVADSRTNRSCLQPLPRQVGGGHQEAAPRHRSQPQSFEGHFLMKKETHIHSHIF
jgi:hypothetical protein